MILYTVGFPTAGRLSQTKFADLREGLTYDNRTVGRTSAHPENILIKGVRFVLLNAHIVRRLLM